MKLLPLGGRSLYPTIGIFGMSGVGKTSLAATADRPLFADSNAGTMSIDHVKELSHGRRVQVHDMKDLDTLYDNITGTGQRNWRKKFGSVVFDSFDDIQMIILSALAERAQDNREEPDQIELREWGIMANKLRRYLRKMKRLPVTKILIMGEKYYEKEDWMYPHLLGQMRDELPYFLDHAIYLHANDKGARYLELNPKQGEYYAKTRARWLTPEERHIRFRLDDYTCLAKLMKKIADGPQATQRTESAPVRRKKIRRK
jgi:hypothetical protein